ncbi:uncharacterized protein TRUGW13939_01106 [Talaromyces rugulosus]|uniref:Uncharacterized protein n=1 Tax=Talaromyces rugulosus TaxID=121627 RepID=A0A7H8QJA8_TALRU|nr:uncharacterized protein TRUGW13939_01106 [Talaromyces rugulosus]QKX54024.1 hypothetical protein TRUGW13939_01106 [Talaromyces rugulosus]
MVTKDKETEDLVDVDVQLWQDKKKVGEETPPLFWVEIARHKLSRFRDKPGAAAALFRPPCDDLVVPNVSDRQPRKQIVETIFRSR